VTDIKFHPITIAGDDGLNGLVAFVKGVVELGGSELQLNVVGRDTLIDAQVHPDKYQNLIVRVWGFSAHFVSLPKEYQDHIIARTEH
jgi:formate C-acetyltransferase